MAELGFRLIKQGHRLVDRIEDAEVVVVNTCAVTSETEAKTRRMLRQWTRRAPHIDICVTGCLGQLKALDMKGEPHVRWVVGNARKNEIPEIVEENRDGVFLGEQTDSPQNVKPFFETPIAMQGHHRTRLSIKIQEGCNFRCAYCIVPFLRGPSRSASIMDVMSACSRAIDAGYKELVLTGTHIGQFQEKPGNALMRLLEGAGSLAGDFRIRLSSLDPRDCGESLLNMIGNNPRFCRHLHLSVQSFCPEVLTAMNRPSTGMGAFIETLINFRTRFPDAGIGGDFIVGFPGETEANFRETLEQVEKIGFSYGHVFRYSKRPMTPAAGFSGQIDEKEKSRRSARLRAAIDRSYDGFVRRLMGTRHRIIVEKEGPVYGRASNYLQIEAPEASAPRNSWLMVKIHGLNRVSGLCQALPITTGEL
jgi:threonylcarbamoyladenosine tRNA methylthiotransferase MtaB